MKNFTNLYQLSKTLKFELKPLGKDGKPLTSEDTAKLFESIIAEDKKIKEAYDSLKPVMDKIHEQVITNSLKSDGAKKIDFSGYFEKYRQDKKKKGEEHEQENKDENSEEKSLREKIGKTFESGINLIKEKAGNNDKGKPILKEKGIKCLTKAGILQYIEKNIDELVDDEEKREELKATHLPVFRKFFTYFQGYNQNRENYYEVKERSTAVATRIVHDNLPKFCDNCILFLSRKEDYRNAKQYLEDKNKPTMIKDAETNKMIEAAHIEEAMFDIGKFSEYLSQANIDEYNKIIGHYNLLINLYNQARHDEKEFKNLSHFKTLYKQIGCGKRKALFEEITDEEGLKTTLQNLITAGQKYFNFEQPIDTIEVKNIPDFIAWLKERKEPEDWKGIYWSKAAVNIISGIYFANWFEIKEQLKNNEIWTCVHLDKNKEVQINDAVELSGLFAALDEEKIPFKESVFAGEEYKYRNDCINKDQSHSQNLINLICADMKNLAEMFLKKSSDILEITDYKNEDNNILAIKNWLDNAIFVMRMVKYFSVKEKKVKGNLIDSDLSEILNVLLRSEDAQWFNQYDLVRNFLSKKPQDDAEKNKLKLNFGSSSFLSGWVQEYGTKAGLIFEKDGIYYLAINRNRLSKEDVQLLNKDADENPCNRIILDFQKPDNKNTPRLFIRSSGDNFAPAVREHNLPIKDVIDIYDSGKFKTKYRKVNELEYNESLRKLIDYFKDGFKKHKSYKHYKFAWKSTNEYKDIEEFYRDTEISCYQVKFEKINWNTFLKFVADEKLYLFQIYNKDFSQNKKPKKDTDKDNKDNKDNIHTYYWKMLFDESNLKNIIYKLSGEAEIFFREKLIDYTPEKDKNGREKGHHYEQLKEKFDYPIISNKRYVTNKLLFHCPIILNFKAKRNVNINDLVNSTFTNSDNIQFLGIDRGEKHLVYYSLIDAKGNIIEQTNFDEINGKDYLQEINDAVDRRKKKQENWQQKGNIKNLKDGYTSLVIHEIIEKMKDEKDNFKPTFIVLEDLNTGFKRGRQKFEQQIYQKFEVALAKKLNYLVDKNAKDGEIASVSKALQLTPLVANYQDIENKKQVGIMLYTRANYTSITDPATGWRKTIYLQKGSEELIKSKILDYFSEIGIDEKGDYFFDYKTENDRTWRLWSGKDGKSLDRYRFRRGNAHNEGIIEEYDIKKILDALFKKFDKSKSLLSQLKGGVELSKCEDENYKKWTAWESLRFVIDIIQQIRNSGRSDDNFLQSPVRNEEGEHFDSRYYEKKDGPKLPKDGDANGAYNIARKGIIMYEHIKQYYEKEKSQDLNLFISDEEWDLWLQDKNKWQKQLSEFAFRTKNTKKEPKTKKR
ncbi:MAG: type V CRISPR-associated protein Cas12a/Cpf1 [Bacteroidales bacterium]|jgi:CRISPR-associated protein Cpf1|nr:type V CRISPR-associated protein Cas12a/Cpf1 [Bacteroidales bacterium]